MIIEIMLYKPYSGRILRGNDMEVKIESWFIESFKKIKSLSEQHPELNWHIPL